MIWNLLERDGTGVYKFQIRRLGVRFPPGVPTPAIIRNACWGFPHARQLARSPPSGRANDFNHSQTCVGFPLASASCRLRNTILLLEALFDDLSNYLSRNGISVARIRMVEFDKDSNPRAQAHARVSTAGEFRSSPEAAFDRQFQARATSAKDQFRKELYEASPSAARLEISNLGRALERVKNTSQIPELLEKYDLKVRQNILAFPAARSFAEFLYKEDPSIREEYAKILSIVKETARANPNDRDGLTRC